jgi:putative membrane-bound dehydrogenase-like protein
MRGRRARRLVGIVAATVAAISTAAFADDSRLPAHEPGPKSLDPRLTIELFADAPQIVTPTDLAVDHLGRVWAIESNTHFPPAGYKGHSSDRILVFRPSPSGGKAADPQVFADGFRHAMSIAVPYGDGVYVATRREVFHLVDKDGDGKPGERRSILKLETKGDYPHNGLAGFAFDGLGYMYIGLGENLGADYRLVGTDGRAISGGGEGGSLFRFKPDGTDLSLWATGFWNPHASCVDAFGNMFTVDNDPDDRPPCRLLHIIPGGDYGYRFRNGRRGIHPFTAWDGELPGTLPMMCGTGEAPSGIIAYESDTFPEDFRGSLLASSWGDHRIDRFRPQPKGTSFTAKLEPIIVGGDNFRPVGVALAPDGTVYITDWVLKDYSVHGKGRIWRILPTQLKPNPVDDLEEIDRLPYEVNVEVVKKLNSPRMDIRRQAARHINPSQLPPYLHFHGNKKRSAGPDYDKLISSRGWQELYWAWCRGARMNHLGRVLPLRCNLSDAAWPDFEWKQRLLEIDGPTAQGSEALAKSADEDQESLRSRLKQPGGENPSRVLVRLFESPRPWDTDPTWLSRALAGGDPFVFATVVECLTGVPAADVAQLIRPERTPSIPVRLALLLAARHSHGPDYAETVLAGALKDPDPHVRFTAIEWVGEGRLAKFRGEIERELSNPKTTADLFEAALASLEMLDGVKRSAKNEFSGADYALRLACDPKVADNVRAMALQIVPLDHKKLSFAQLTRLMKDGGPQLRFEALRTFRNLPFPQGPEFERALARDEHADKNLRLEAIAGLALALERDEHDAATVTALRRLLTGADPELACEALRALRRSAGNPDVQGDLKDLSARLEAHPAQGETRAVADQVVAALRSSDLLVPKKLAALTTPRPNSVDDWIRLAADGGDPEAGRRLFDFPNSAACYRCHAVHGRGGKIGPDLSTIARASDRTKLAESILRPAKEIAPQFAMWSFVTRDGRTLSGVLVSEDREGHVRIGGADGHVTEIDASQIDERRQQATSIMPERLTDLLTVGEFRDLIAFLATLK